MEYSGARIQLLDLPGIVEGASQGMIFLHFRRSPLLICVPNPGRGRGRQVNYEGQGALVSQTIGTPKCQSKKRPSGGMNNFQELKPLLTLNRTKSIIRFLV